MPSVLGNTISAVALNLNGVISSIDLGVSSIAPVLTIRVSHDPVRNIVRGNSPSNNRDGMIGSSGIIGHENSSSSEIHERSSVYGTSDRSSSVYFVHHILSSRHVDFSVLSYSVCVKGLWSEARSAAEAFFANGLSVTD